MRRPFVVGLLFVVAVALVMRVGDLAFESLDTYRPLHGDEAVNAFKLEELRTKGVYRYDPEEFHGPALYYLARPVVAVFAWFRPDRPIEVGMRCVPVLFGVGLALLPALLVWGLGRGPVLWSGLLTAVSPAFVFYSRYFIHETLLVFFSLLTMASLWAYSRRPSVAWAMATGAGVGLMYATKETFVFAVVAMAAGWALATAWEGLPGGKGGARRGAARLRDGLRRIRGVDVAVAVVAGGAIWVLFLTSFLQNARGPWDAIRTYWIWVQRAGGASPHVHAWSFYFERLFWFRVPGGPLWTEGAVAVLALIGLVPAFRRGKGEDEPSAWAIRFVGIYTVVLAAIYVVIPYKTPWCALGFLQGILLLAGWGAWRLVNALPTLAWRGTVGVALLAAVVHLGWQAFRANGRYAADFRNPHVYAHTSADIFNLLEQVKELGTVAPEGHATPMAVMAPGSEYWPLPWYLRRFENAGWWEEVVNEPYPPVMIAAQRLRANIEEKTDRKWLMVGLFELRPRFFVELYVEAGLWERFLAARARE